MKYIVFIGAGGHAKSVLDSISGDYKLFCYVDEFKKGVVDGLPIYQSIEDIPNYINYYYFVTIGNNCYRKKWFDLLMRMGLKTLNIIDRTALISENVIIGTGNFIGKEVILNSSCKIGNNNIINTRALVEHECIVNDNVHISTNAVINGNVIVRDNCFIGSMSVCNGQITIGENSIIGSGSVVIKDIPSNVTAVGVPAKIIKTNGETL